MIMWLLMEEDLFCVSSEVLAHKKQPYGTFFVFFLFDSAQKALNSCLSHIPMLHALWHSDPSWPQSQHDKLHLFQQQQIKVR